MPELDERVALGGSRSDSRRAFESILDRLEGAIEAGELGPGDRLPPERDLAARYGFSRPSVREALRVLEALGLVTVRRGAEHGVMLREAPENALAHLFRFHLALEHTSVASLVEFRAMIETWAAAVVGADPSPETLRELTGHLDAMTAHGEPDAFHAFDAAFHLALVRGAGNELATLALEAARGAIERTMVRAIAAAPDWPATRAQLVAEHREIAGALAAREPERAAALVGGHIRSFYEDHVG